MKILPAEPPVIDPRLAGPKVELGQTSFEVCLVQAGERRTALPVRAFGFTELGVFGTGQPMPWKEPDDPGTQPSVAPAPTPHAPIERLSVGEAAPISPILTAAAADGPPAMSLRPGPPADFRTAGRLSTSPPPPKPPDLDTAHPRRPPAREAESERPAPRPRPRPERPQAPPPAGSVTVTVHSADNGLAVHAAVWGSNPEHLARLRARAAELTWSYGEVLSEFTVNGLRPGASPIQRILMAIGAIGPKASAQDSAAFGLDFQSLLKIILTQLTYQDPLKPVDNFEFISQLAQFSQLQQSQTLNDKVDNLLAAQAATQATSLLGRTVDVQMEQAQLSGVVQTVSFAGDAPTVTIRATDGTTYSQLPIANIFQVR